MSSHLSSDDSEIKGVRRFAAFPGPLEPVIVGWIEPLTEERYMRLNEDWKEPNQCPLDRLSIGLAIGIVAMIFVILPSLGALLGD